MNLTEQAETTIFFFLSEDERWLWDRVNDRNSPSSSMNGRQQTRPERGARPVSR
jgi:hypothetical protein